MIDAAARDCRRWSTCVTAYRLTTSFPYLVNRVGVRIGEMFSRRLAPYNLTLPMYRVLAALWEAQNQRLRDLGDMTTIEVTTLSRLVGSLHQRGLVSRTRVAGNERTVSINLTARGRALAEILIPLATHFENVAIHSFGSEDIRRLKDALRTVYEHLNELEAEVHPAADSRRRSSKRRAPRRKHRKGSSLAP